jgi:nicotinate-nucleotide adenylyltransferase
MQQPLAVHLAPAGGIAPVAMTGLDISATFVRTAVRSGQSVRYLLPDSVLAYIRAHNLYIGEATDPVRE